MSETQLFSNYPTLLKKYGIECEGAFLDLLILIDCPENFQRLAVVLGNTISALSSPLLFEISQSPTIQQQVVETLDAALKLKHLIEKCQDPLLFNAATGAEHPDKALRNTLKSNPRYTLLYVWDPKAEKGFQKFHQAILFLEPLIKASRNLEFKVSDYVRASLGFRRLLKSKQVTDFLNNFAGNVTSVQQIHVYLDMLADVYREQLNLPSNPFQLKKIRNDKTHESHQLVLDYDNAKYVRRVIGLIRGVPIKRRNVDRKSSGFTLLPRSTKRLKDSLLVPFTYEELSDDNAVIFGLIESPEELDPEIIESGEMPDEDETGTILVIDESIPLESYVHEFHKRRTSNDIIKRLERQNNYVALTLQQLSPREIQTLIKFVTAPDVSEEDQVQKIILVAMFFTSSPFERAINIRVVDCINIEKDKPESELTYDLSTNHWIIKAYDLNYKTISDPYSDSFKTSSYFRLSAPMLCAAVFQRFSSQRRSRESRVIGYTLEECEQQLSKTLKKLKHFKKGAMARISNHMHILCCQVYGQATASLLFNRDPLGSLARNYYTTLPIDTMVKRYKHLLNILLPIVSASFTTMPKINIKPIEGKSYIGAKWHPSWVHVVQCIRILVGILVKNSKNWHRDEGWISFHNTYTAYVLFCTSLLTGLRPINTPMVVPEKVILSAKVFVHREKSKSDEFNTRFIPLSDTALELMRHYDNHLLSVKGRLLRAGIMPSEVPKLFFLRHTPERRGKTTLVNFSVSEYKNIIFKYLFVPINSNRRLLRGFFEDPSILGSKLSPVPFEIIDAILGHANIGEQYWSSSSTLSMRAIREYIEPYLKEIEKILKIISLPGMQA